MFSLQTEKVMRVLFLAIFAALFSTAPVFAAPPATTPIFRAQIRVVTANVSDAGSDDYVKVDLNSDNRTWIESDQDDFAGNDDQTYDLRLDYVNQLSSINYLKIEKTGSDGWCVKQIHLIINGRTIYSADFGAGRWLDNESGFSRIYFIDGSFMRGTGTWMNYSSPSKPYVTPVHDMRLRIESAVGDFAAYNLLTGHEGYLMAREGTYGTELYPINANTWRVNLDLEEDNAYYNKNVDVDFDLRVNCSNGRPVFTTANVTADDGDALFFARETLPLRLNEMMKNFNYGGCSTMNIVLASNGDLHIAPTFVLPPPPPIRGRSFADESAIGLQINSSSEITAYKPTVFSATVNNELTEDTEAEVSFELSANILPFDGVIEAKDNKGVRRITVQEMIRQADGTS